MIVVVGALGDTADRAVAVAAAAVRAGATTQVVGSIPEGSTGDARMVALARSGIGHSAVVRRPTPAGAIGIDAADLGLALRYLPDVRAVILLDGSAAAAPKLSTTHAAISACRHLHRMRSMGPPPQKGFRFYATCSVRAVQERGLRLAPHIA